VLVPEWQDGAMASFQAGRRRKLQPQSSGQSRMLGKRAGEAASPGSCVRRTSLSVTRRRDRGAPYLRDYYAFTGSYVENIVRGMGGGDEKVKELISLYSSIGADEVMLWPTISEMGQLDLLSRLLIGR